MWDADAYERALDFAAKAHGRQTVPGTDLSYVVHLAKVAAEVMRACALDPDADATTERESLPKAERMRDSLARIVRAPREIAMVKLAERITNLEPVTYQESA
jgi:(p)ppGpp synthase/HD superfamily hydrolase